MIPGNCPVNCTGDGFSHSPSPGVEKSRMIKAPLRVETARLILSPPTADDVQAIFERYASDPDVTRFMAWPRHESTASTEAFVTFSAQEWERAAAGPYLIWSRADGSLLGASGLEVQERGRSRDRLRAGEGRVGKGLRHRGPERHGERGSSLGLERLTACCHLEHRASQRVLEKCGFRREPATARLRFRISRRSAGRLVVCAQLREG